MKKPGDTFASLNAQIAKLQEQAVAQRAKEIGQVVAGIRDAIKHYALTATDLGLGGAKAKASMKVGRTAPKKSGTKRSARPIKFADGQGNTWSGMGKRPDWFKAALAAGKKPQDLLTRAAG